MYQIYQNPWAQSDEVRKTFLSLLRKPAELSVEFGFPSGLNVTGNVEYKSNPYPVVFLVTGAGGNGKDTWIDMIGKYCSICNLSSITECKDIADQLIAYTKEIENDMPVCGSKHRDVKSDEYRTFLNDLKAAWIKFNDGPNYNLFQQLNDIIGDQIVDKCRYDAVFMHIREYDEIMQMKDLVEKKLGLLCYTMIVKGLVDPDEYTNPGDHDAESHEYDLTIINTPNKLGMLNVQAMLFAENLISANALYGYPCAAKSSECDTSTGTEDTSNNTTEAVTTAVKAVQDDLNSIFSTTNPLISTGDSVGRANVIKEMREKILTSKPADFERNLIRIENGVARAAYESSTEDNVSDKDS